MHSSYQHHETRYANLSLPVHDRISDLHRRARGLAPAVAESALDSGCTDHRPAGTRQSRAWDMVAEAHGWNAISDNPGQLALAEQLESEGTAYKIEYVGGTDPGASPWEIVLTDKWQRIQHLAAIRDEHGGWPTGAHEAEYYRLVAECYGLDRSHNLRAPEPQPRPAASTTSRDLDQAQHQANQAYLMGNISEAEWQSAIGAISEERNAQAAALAAETHALVDDLTAEYGLPEPQPEPSRSLNRLMPGEVRAAYTVTMHGQPHIRPAGWVSYPPLQAGEAFDKALGSARDAARRAGHRYDVRHTERGVTTFCVGVLADGALIWRD